MTNAMLNESAVLRADDLKQTGAPIREPQRKELFERLARLSHEAAAVFDALAALEGKPIEQALAASDCPPPAAHEPVTGSEGGLIERFLAERYLSLVALKDRALIDDARVSIANHIATTYPRCKTLLDAIKRTQGKGGTIALDLSRVSHEERSAMTALGAKASRAMLLPAYHYRKAPHCRLYCRAPEAPEAINFFTGAWLEIWAHAKLLEVLEAAGGSWEVVRGVQFFFPDQTQFELDLLAVHPDGRALWVEAKTGRDFADRLVKYKRVRRRLGLTAERALLLASDLGQEERIPARLAEMRPATLATFEARLREAIEGR